MRFSDFSPADNNLLGLLRGQADEWLDDKSDLSEPARVMRGTVIRLLRKIEELERRAKAAGR